MQYLFGPVLSSRLGRSLGLDLLGERICSMDCVYCECGQTDRLTMQRAPYVPAEEVLDEVRAWAEEGHAAPDHVTLGGLGEPCLNADMGRIINGLREVLPGVPVAVLTNATLLHDPQVRAELALADVVLPSLDSLVPEEYRAVNRPHPKVDPARVAADLLAFRREFEGRLYLEVLLAAGMNDSEHNLELLSAYVRELAPERVDVVTLSRPGAVPEARGVGREVLQRWRTVLCATDKSRAVVRAKGGLRHEAGPELARSVLASLARRPQTVLELAEALEAEEAEVARLVEDLLERGRLKRRSDGDRVFYQAS